MLESLRILKEAQDMARRGGTKKSQKATPTKPKRPPPKDTKRPLKPQREATTARGLSKLAADLDKDTQLPAATKKRILQSASRNVVEQFRSHVPKALATILSIMEDADASQRDRLRAADIILERAYGKAPRTTVHAVVKDLHGSELEQRALAILERRGLALAKNVTPGDTPHTPMPPSGGGGVSHGSPRSKKGKQIKNG